MIAALIESLGETLALVRRATATTSCSRHPAYTAPVSSEARYSDPGAG